MTHYIEPDEVFDQEDYVIEVYRPRVYHFNAWLRDIDDFKAINDSCGHMAGDQVLLEVTRRVEEKLALLQPGLTGIEIDRKVLADMAVRRPQVFAELAEAAKAAQAS